MHWQSPHARDEALAEHEAGHPDSDPRGCIWCGRDSGFPSGIDDPIPPMDADERRAGQ
jgi:hypothetical protein